MTHPKSSNVAAPRENMPPPPLPPGAAQASRTPDLEHTPKKLENTSRTGQPGL